MKNNLIEIKNNQVLTTSLKVAEKFNKSHKHIIDKINNLINNLTSAEKALIKKYRCLTPEGKATVDAVIDVQYEVVKPRVKNDEVI